MAARVPARGCQGRYGKRPRLLAECPQKSPVSLAGAANFAEMRVMVPGSPVVKRVRAVPGCEDCGQAAPATVNHVTLGGEREGRQAQAGPCGCAEQIKRRITAVSKGPDPAPPDLRRVQEERVQPRTAAPVPRVPLWLADQRRPLALRG